MPPFRISIRSRKRATRRGRGRKGRKRGRTRLRLAVVGLVLVAAVGVYLHVALARRFEGRLWMLPSRIYSNTLVVSPGDPIDAIELARRLDRSGYGRAAGTPDRPGQYNRNGSLLEVYRRPFEAAGIRGDARHLRLRFRAGRLRSITDDRGRAVRRAEFEPELLATLFGPRQEERLPVRLEDVPGPLRDAVLAAEDARFFEHHGLDLRGIVRASWVNLRRGKIVQGGSTITQQTVKNIFLGQERTWWRKAREGLLSVMLDARYAKERILEVYLNEVYLGQRGPVAICGVQAASRFYFGRDVAGRYNPFADRDRALERRSSVLGTMQRLGMITEQQVEAGRAERLGLASGSCGFARAPYAVDFVRRQLAETYSAETLRWEGLRIFTTLDTTWQTHAEDALHRGLERLERGGRAGRGESLQGVVLVLEPATGAIRAMVGGRDYATSQFNRATHARRQPGSCFKPFVYAAGFERTVRGDGQGLTPATLLDDSPLEMVSGGETWRPANYDGEYRGWVTVRTALEQSLNVPTVRAAQRVGLERVVDTARRMGIESPLRSLPSLALGTIEVTPLELAAGYSTLARLGRQSRPWVIREIVDRDGNVLFRSRASWSRAISPQATYLVNRILHGVLTEGTARSAGSLGYHGGASGKTGTTDDTRDAWFVGYSDRLLSLVWVGKDDNSETGLTGATGALPIWVDLMARAGAEDRHAPTTVPEGIVERRIDPETGGLVRRGCPTWIDERFAEGSEPQHSCVLHGNRFRRWFRKLRGRPPFARGEGV
jgi:penicillin-binding protein 1B